MIHKIRVSFDIEISTDIKDEFDPDKLTNYIKRNITDWSDGRYNHNTENILMGLESIVDCSVSNMVHRHYYKITGNDMVEVAPDFHTSKAHLTAEEVLENGKTYITINAEQDDIKVECLNSETN